MQPNVWSFTGSIPRLVGKKGLVALLGLSSWCPVMVDRLFLAVLRGCLQFVIVVFPDHTHLLFWAHSFITSCQLLVKDEH